MTQNRDQRRVMTQTMDQERNDDSELGPEEKRGIRRGTSDVLMIQNRVEGRTDDSEQ
jgi:hypothetical protein